MASKNNSLGQLVYEFTQQAFHQLSQGDPGMWPSRTMTFKEAWELCSGRIMFVTVPYLGCGFFLCVFV